MLNSPRCDNTPFTACQPLSWLPSPWVVGIISPFSQNASANASGPDFGGFDFKFDRKLNQGDIFSFHEQYVVFFTSWLQAHLNSNYHDAEEVA